MRLWGQIWRRFEQDLTQLVEVEVNCLPFWTDWGDDNEPLPAIISGRKVGYSKKFFAEGYFETNMVVPGEEGDERAFEHFLTVVNARRQQLKVAGRVSSR